MFKILLISLFSLCINFSYAQKKLKYEPTFLWRISGNGLTQSSYLYGTIHVKDPLIFQLGDSIYAAINQCKFFATELDASEALLYVEEAINNEEEDSDTTINASKLKAKFKFENFSSADAAEMIRLYNLKKKASKRKPMPLILDSYLSTYASDLGLKIGSVERGLDRTQQKATNAVGLPAGYQITNSKGLLAWHLERLKELYVARDLQTISNSVDEYFSERYKKDLLTDRNYKMATMIDSTAKTTSGFFAVGCAHLPGKEGLIEMLRQKGYQVNPVISSKTVPPVAQKSVTDSWVKRLSKNKNASFYLPKDIKEQNVEATGASLYYGLELGLGAAFFVLEFPNQDFVETDTKFKENALETLNYVATKVKSQKLNFKNGLRSLDGVMLIDKEIFRYRVLQKARSLFLLYASFEEATMTSLLKDEYMEYFFNNFAFEQNTVATKFETHSNPEMGFQVAFPSASPSKYVRSEDNTESVYLSSVDPNTNARYSVQVYHPSRSYDYTSDEGLIKIDESLKDNEGCNVDTTLKLVNGFLRAEHLCYCDDRLKTKMQRHVEGNKVTVLKAEYYNDTAGSSTFFNSFKADIRATSYRYQKSLGGEFETFAPEPFTIEVDTTAKPGEVDQLSFDTLLKINYHVVKEPLDYYYYAKDDTTMLNDFNGSGWQYSDSLIENKATIEDKQAVVYKLYKKYDAINLYRKIKLFYSGDTLYSVSSLIPWGYLNHPNVQKFFSSIKPTKKWPIHFTVNKKKEYLQKLLKGDSIVAEKAIEQFYLVDWEKEDLPDLYHAVIYDFSKNYFEKYSYYHDKLVQSTATIVDNSIIDFVETHYDTLKTNLAKESLIKLLYSCNTVEARNYFIKTVKEKSPPFSDPVYLGYYGVRDSFELWRPFYQDVFNLTKTDETGNLTIKMLAEFTKDSAEFVTILNKNADLILNKAARYIKTYHDSLNNKTHLLFDYKNLLELIPNKASTQLLQSMAKYDDPYLQENILKILFKRKAEIPQVIFDSLAKNGYYRLDLYDFCKENKLLNRIPSKYLTQEAMGAACLENWLQEDDLYRPEMKFVKLKTATLKGKKNQFYVYKVNISDEETPNFVIAIVGIFSTDFKNLEQQYGKYGQCFIDYDNPFNPKRIDTVLAEFLSSLEENENLEED